jgi:RimJ/RimL family protein N-acetyltransferase
MMALQIKTPRLLLRVPTIEDAEMILEAMQPVWPSLQMWMSWAFDGTNTIKAVKEGFIAKAEASNFLIGLCKETGKFVISTGINPREGYSGQYETGYWVAQEFLGKDYATEATNAAIRYGFNALSAESVYICHYEGNGPSERVIQKLNFTKTGVREKAHGRCLDGTLLDVHDYVMRDPSVLPELAVYW